MADQWNVVGVTDTPQPPQEATLTPQAQPAKPDDPWKVAKVTDAPPPPHRTGFLDAAGTRVMDTLYGTAQLVSHLNPLADPAETAHALTTDQRCSRPPGPGR